MKVGEKILPGVSVRGKGTESKELSKGVSSDMIQNCETVPFNPYVSHPEYLSSWRTVLLSQRDPEMVGWCVVGTSVRDIPLTSLLTFQAPHRLLFLLLTVFASSSVFFLPQGEVGESGLPGAHGLPGAPGPKVTLRVSGAISQGQISSTQA